MGRFLVAALLALASCAPAVTEPPERAAAIESRVWSPYCPGRLLADCTTRQAGELREEIARRIEAGQTDAQVLAWIRRNYGDEALADPAPGRRGLALWLVPIAAIVAGAGALAFAVRRWSRAPATPPAADRAPDDEWVRRVREEVEREP